MVIRSWKSETKRPLILVGEISAMYKGTEKEEIPMASPIKRRAAISTLSLGAHPDQAAPIIKMTAAIKMTFFCQ